MSADPSAISEAKQQPLSHICVALTPWLLSPKMRFLHSLKLMQNVTDTHSGSIESHFLFCLGIFQLLQLRPKNVAKVQLIHFYMEYYQAHRPPFQMFLGYIHPISISQKKKQGQWTHWESHIDFNGILLEAPQPRSTVKKFWKAPEDTRLNH